MRDWILRNQPQHAPKLLGGLVVIACMLVSNPKIEPGVRQRQILLLNANQFRYSCLGLARTKQR